MGVLDSMGMMRKAMQAQAQMKKIKAVGRGGFLAFLINGLSDIDAVEADREEFKSKYTDFGLTDQQIDRLLKDLENNIKVGLQDAKKELEKQIRNSTSIDDLKGMLGM